MQTDIKTLLLWHRQYQLDARKTRQKLYELAPWHAAFKTEKFKRLSKELDIYQHMLQATENEMLNRIPANYNPLDNE